MSKAENVIAMLFLHDVRQEARNEGKATAARGVKCLRETVCLDAFVAEWTIAKMAWVDQQATRIKNPLLYSALKHMIHNDVKPTHSEAGERFNRYGFHTFQLLQDDQPEHGLGTLFFQGFCSRLEEIPRKPRLFGKKDISPHEHMEIMDAVHKACWSLSGDLESVLEAIRPRVTKELMDLL